jgi:carbon-monoxide dehydrogenase medium subunit
MKPAPFVYYRPTSVQQALDMLDSVAEEGGRILAGGQSLVPMMALRVAQPTHLVDINAIAELERTSVEGRDFVIGALARHQHFIEPAAPGPLGRLLAEVAHHIAHYPIRERGTYCGSVAHADPASEWCLVTATLDGSIVARHAAGSRAIPSADYFKGIMTTALAANEMVFEVRLPLLEDDERVGFAEFNRRAGDLALGMSLVTLRLQDGAIAHARVGVGSVEECARRIPEAEAQLCGRAPSDAVFRAAADAAANAVEPMEDAQTDADYRRDLVRSLVRRALEQAVAAS